VTSFEIRRRELMQRGAGVLASVLLPAPAFAQAQKNPWAEVASMPMESGEVLGAVSQDKFYVFAGLAPGFQPRRLVLEFDPVSNKWAGKQQMPYAAHHVAVASLDDEIYLCGGFTPPRSSPPAFVPVSEAWAYKPASDTWRKCAPMPKALGAAAATAFGGKIYVAGGVGAAVGVPALTPPGRQSVLSSLYQYDPKQDSWKECSAMPTPRNHLVLASIDDKIIAIGGRIGSVFVPGSNNLDLSEPYDPEADRWGPALARMPTARSGMAWGVRGARIYIAGGEYQTPGLFTAYSAVEMYDGGTGRWSRLPPMSMPRHGAAGGIVGNRFYVAGGEAQSGGNGVRAEIARCEALFLDMV
jgi:N-acetylneuraminic acid mutarotase